MIIKYDKKANALSIILKKGRVSIDKYLSENIFAGLSKTGELLEIQILEFSKKSKPHQRNQNNR